MSTVKSGDAVKVHYTGKFDDGDVFDSSEGREPLAFTVGAGEVIPGFDQALVGMQIGETKSVVIPPEQAYGERINELVQTIDRGQFNLEGVEPELGMAIEMRTPQGSIPLVVTELTDTTVTLDANHPLAGEELHFALTLVEIAA
ncbi:MAG TPA: peptidylprolyl isomerase [Blastocatellia bacterium]|nr:peptidylprolyl isomerase [Blastocatellia bacterium]HMX27147.1 peptidylprolyl isomerase [Blastocatellia bacterium]HMY73026.1 peptidylprolyl isomerase [Blastocatellia bacterium]HMZ16631.1 peptidylprolyl isomerase [Blastocatellia bacterium]HNG32070.1 peptidylprolyl isomerase [Blastocatellia bacterium]